MFIISIFVMLMAFVVAGVAGYFSIVGLSLIFSGAYWSTVVMGSSLEISKIVVVSWLFRHWDVCGKILRTYLLGAIIILMLITSIGIYGYLARSHIEQQTQLATGVASNIKLIQTQVEQTQKSMDDINNRIALIDDSIRNLITNNRATSSLRAQEQYQKTRQELINQRTQTTKELNQLLLDKTKAENEVSKQQVEVGPIRYVAEFIFGVSDNNTLERAVRWMIIIIIIVFDPLSIAMILAANTGFAFNRLKNKEKSVTIDTDFDSIFVGKEDIRKL